MTVGVDPARPGTVGAVGLRATLRQAEISLDEDPAAALTAANEVDEAARRLQDNELRACACLTAGAALTQLGRPNEASERLGEAAALYRGLKSREGEARALSSAAVAARLAGDVNAAGRLGSRALDLARASGSAEIEGETLNTLAGIRHSEGDYASALDLTFQNLKLRRATLDREGEVKSLSNLGLIYTHLGDYPQALDFLTQAHRVARDEIGDPKVELRCLVNIGLLHENINDHERSLEYYESALETARSIGDRTSEAVCTLNASNVLQRLERLPEALERLEAVLALAREIDFRQAELHALQGIGQVRQRLGDLDSSLESLQAALEIASQSDNLEGQVATLLAMGSVYLDRHQHPIALDVITQALELAQHSGLKREVFEAHEKLADAYRLSGDPASALEHYVEFHRLEREIFNDESERKTRVLAVQFEVEKSRREAEFYRLRTEIESQAREEAEAKVRERTLELEAAQVEVVTRLAVAAEYRDDQTGDHTRRVGSYSALIARELGLPESEVELVRLAARLHDVGKIGTPDAILLKPGKLTLEEFRIMESHAAIGARILSGGHSRLLKAAEEIALTHHERWDGRGYPRGLAGNEIPLLGRIVSVADVFDALTSERPYKRAWSAAEALEEIVRQAGNQFDPKVVAAAQRVLTGDLIARPELPGDAVAGEPGENLAFIDSETGLGNAAAYEADLGNEVLRGARRGYGVRVATVTLEGAGPVQERDGVEKAVATAMRARLREVGRAYRLGEGTYAAILTSAGSDAAAVQTALEQALATIAWPEHAAFTARVTVSELAAPEVQAGIPDTANGGG